MGSLPGAGRVAMALAMRGIRVIKHAPRPCNGAGASYGARANKSGANNRCDLTTLISLPETTDDGTYMTDCPGVTVVF